MGYGNRPEFAQLRVVERLQASRRLRAAHVQRRHRVQPKQIQPRHAEVHAFDGPIVEARDAQRAAVAHAPAQDFPGVGEIVAILPDDRAMSRKCFGLAWPRPNGTADFNRAFRSFWSL